jgi:sugar phosphate isomerase/epimerase
MELGVSIWGFYHQQPPETWNSLADTVDAILAVEPSLGVEIWGSRAVDDPTVEGRALAALIGACSAAAYTTVHVQGRHMSWNPRGLRGEIALAHQLGAETLVLHPACLGLSSPDGHPDWPEIARITEDAAKFGVRLAMENLPDSMATLDRLLEKLGDDPKATNLGICIDVGHAALSHDAGREPIRNYLERYIGQLVHLHLHDNLGTTDDHLVPGRGVIDWENVLGAILDAAYAGTAILEVYDPGGDPADAVRQSLDRIRSVSE